jgi:MFS family permease
MFRSLRVRNYRLYATGQLISVTGTWMQRVAQDWLVLELTNSGVMLGLVTAFQFAPSLLVGLWGGALADRFDKRILLLLTQTAIALCALALGLLDLTGLVATWQVMVLAAAIGFIGAVDTPARQSFAVEMVGRNDLANAVGINSTIFNIGRVVGPVAAGVTISQVGTGWAFIANAISGIAVVTALTLMRSRELHPTPHLVRAPGQLRESITYVRGRSDLVLPMVLVFIVGTFGLNFQITAAILAKQVFHRGADGFGLLSAFFAIGACIGALIAARRQTRPSSTFLVGAAVAFGTLEAIVGLMPSFGATLALLIPTGILMLLFTTGTGASIQLGADAIMRGRVTALYLMCLLGGTPIGAVLIGWIATVLGPRWGMIGGGGISAAAALSVGWVMARRQNVTAREVIGRMRDQVRQKRGPAALPARISA